MAVKEITSMKHILAISALVASLAIPALASAAEPLSAAINISGANLSDLVVVGESPKATDGYDVFYDILAPGPSLNDTSITAWFSHPEWQQVKRRE